MGTASSVCIQNQRRTWFSGLGIDLLASNKRGTLSKYVIVFIRSPQLPAMFLVLTKGGAPFEVKSMQNLIPCSGFEYSYYSFNEVHPIDS